MIKSWRPEGWILPFGQYDQDGKEGEMVEGHILTPSELALYEAGADAMLKALREKHSPNVLTPLSPFAIVFRDSKLVLIPNDKENDD